MTYNLTNDTLVINIDGVTHTVRKGAANFVALRAAILATEDNDDPILLEAIRNNLTSKKVVEDWAKGDFYYNGAHLNYRGRSVPNDFCGRIVAMVAKGESPQPLLKFWERLDKNPSYRSVHQLWDFLSHVGIPITPNGCFLAYKSVRQDYKDHHSNTFDNKPGVTNEMPRNQISDDPDVACHEGFHVGALEYAQSFGDDNRRIVIVKVDPTDVVCVPKDYSHQKMRVCKYTVVGNFGDQLPDTTFDDENTVDLENEVTEQDFQEAMSVANPPTATAGPLDRFTSVSSMMQHSLAELRHYATHELKIVGASKIPGGKAQLVERILAVR